MEPEESPVSLTYSNYLRVNELIQLQTMKSVDPDHDKGPEHDEMLFIVIHQVYELWFKQILHELDHMMVLFAEFTPSHDTTPKIRAALKRVLTIFKTLVAQVDILETMTPISFASFREFLDQASGFQSFQFRELEFLLGQRDHRMLRFHMDNPEAYERLDRRLGQPSLYQGFLHYLSLNGYTIPEKALAPLGDAPPPEFEEVREVLIDIYRNDDRIALVCERLVDLDEGLQEWRYRHVKMVERTIGTKRGTGGSPGVDFLRQTLFKPVFPDLWTIRADL